MKELVGRKITGLFVGEGEELLVFQTDTGALVYEAVGDCCSETWFADITGVTALLDATVAEVEEVEVPESIHHPEDGRGRQEYDEIYGYKIRTDKGYVDIVYRNSSNGYYCGWCRLSKNPNVMNAGLVAILDDWSAQ